MWTNDCVGNYWLHDYVVLNETPKRSREICTRCKRIDVFVKADNQTYLKAHKRDFLQPWDRRFHREWGEPNYQYDGSERDTKEE